MDRPLNVLFVEDSKNDVILLLHKLREGGFDVKYEDVDTPEAMRHALEKQKWDIILSDYSMPRFTGIAALKVLKQSGQDLPFILVSGTIGEEIAVEAMRAGASDYVLKDNTTRLIPAIKRELHDAQERHALRKSEEEKARLEEELGRSKETEAVLNASNEAKTMMMREVHHRVKNNLAVIQSLLSMQMRQIRDETYVSFFRKTLDRLKSMALLHEKLYRTGDLKNLEAAEYIHTLSDALFHSYNIGRNIRLSYDLNPALLNVDTMIPLGLIINELVSNALKHAFPDGREGEIKISFTAVGEREYQLAVRDNGMGLPKDFESCKSDSLGISIVTTLVKQLDGKLDIAGEDGTEFRIVFKNKVRPDSADSTASYAP